ncbi:hypothetical protein [Helicobacter canis]|nr:hypothetical protein [Helicobacter canis]
MAIHFQKVDSSIESMESELLKKLRFATLLSQTQMTIKGRFY